MLLPAENICHLLLVATLASTVHSWNPEPASLLCTFEPRAYLFCVCSLLSSLGPYDCLLSQNDFEHKVVLMMTLTKVSDAVHAHARMPLRSCSCTASAFLRVHWSTHRARVSMQVHMARLVLQPNASASPALAHLFETCQKAACDAVAAEHAAAQSSAKEVAVVQTVCACAHKSGSDVQVQVRVVFVGPVRHCSACNLRNLFAL